MLDLGRSDKHDMELITTVKCFVVQAPGICNSLSLSLPLSFSLSLPLSGEGRIRLLFKKLIKINVMMLV
jgi:hypothetical protein